MSIHILDCTLRDGGYINNWEFAENTSKIVNKLSNANVDVIEMGFLRDGIFTKQQTLYNHVEAVYEYLNGTRHQQYSLMIRPDWYDISQFTEAAGKIHIIRFAFYFKDRELTRKYCAYVMDKGYKVFLNPVNICSYTQKDLEMLIAYVNQVKPDVLTIVDTFGSLTLYKLVEIYTYIENNLDKNIGICCHLHENMLLASSLARKFLEISNKRREIYLDGSLNGMGRMPGNLPIEILVDIVNTYNENKYYEIDNVLSAVSQYILPIKEKAFWGYSPAFYFSGKYKVHRSYPEYYLKNGILSLDEIRNILEKISKTENRWGFNKEYADRIQQEYMEAGYEE